MNSNIRVKTSKCRDCFNKPNAFLTEVIRMDPEVNNGNLTWDTGWMNMMIWMKTHRDHDTVVIEDIDYAAERL